LGEGDFTNRKKTAGEVLFDLGTYLLYLPEAAVKDY
jgi:hypothetical protein